METGDNEASSSNEDALLSDTQVVFQCESCRSILGDATNWIAATQPLEAFTLSAVTESVCVGDHFHQSTQAHDAGSSYSLLTCRTCKTEIGRRYITTPSHLDHLRDNFTLYVANITSYQLGSAGVKVVSKFKGQEPVLLLKLAEQCMKIQHLMVNLNQRLYNVEQCLQEGNENHLPDSQHS